MDKIDCHVHVGSYRISSHIIHGWLQITYEDLTHYLSENKIKKCWLLSHPYTVPGYELNNDRQTLLLANSNDNIIPFCSPEYSRDITRLVNNGCMGIGEVKNNLAIDHDKNLQIYYEAGEYGLPVLIHVTDKHCFGSMKNKSFEYVFSNYPKTNFVMHGWEWWNLLGNNMEYLLDNYSNIYMDISANSGFKTLSKDKEYSHYFLNKYYKHILFGTDFPMLTIDESTQFGTNKQHSDLINSLGLSQLCKDNIFYKNAERLIK